MALPPTIPNPAPPPPPPPTQPQFNDEKEHYKSLVSLLKYSMTIISVIVTGIGFALGYITYSNGQEMKDALKAERQEMKDNLAAMKADVKEQKDALKEDLQSQADRLKAKEAEMQQNVEDQSQYLQDKVDAAEQQAQNEIASFKSVATEQARSKIDQIFKENNFDQFVAQVAKERMEPQIEAMVDKGLNKIAILKNRRIDSAISKLSHSLVAEQMEGFEYLQSIKNDDFSDSQINSLINLILDPIPRYYTKDYYAGLLKFTKSPIVKPLFLKIVTDSSISDNIKLGIIDGYLINFEEIRAFNNLFRIIQNTKSPSNVFLHFVRNTFSYNMDAIKQLINFKEMVDFVRKSLSTKDFEALKQFVNEVYYLGPDSEKDLKKNYLFSIP